MKYPTVQNWGMEEWPNITSVTFASLEDAREMAKILNDMMLKINILRKELEALRAEVLYGAK